ncbi:MAG: DUF433 domain-containing protein [Fimbriimonadaceae bacterium]
MTHPYAEWQLTELARLGKSDRARAERVLNALWAAMPGLFEEFAQAAGVTVDVDQPANVPSEPAFALVETSESSVARLAESRIAVWEVVRAHRQSGSMDALGSAFASVDREALEAALDYGLLHREEIDLLIERYESMIENRRAQYPYAR